MLLKQILVTLIIVIINPLILTGQNTSRHAGLRTGYRAGIYYQIPGTGNNPGTAYQMLASFNHNGIQLTGLKIIYESQLDEISSQFWFAWGYGGHAGFIITDHLSYLGEKFFFRGERFSPLFGVNGWAAVEYRFREIPILINLNIKPFVELTIPGFVNIMPGDVGISFAYIF
jgi:hypothetical protein